jgi:hypothetical protein
MTTAYAPVCAGTTATGTLQVASTGLSTSGNVLISNGASSLPSFQTFPNAITKLSTNLTNTNIHNMYATPVQILAAQGAHTLIVIYCTIWEYIFSSTKFSGGDNTFGPLLQYGNTIHGGGVLVSESTIDIVNTAQSVVFYGGSNDGAIGTGNTNTFTNATQAINVGIFASNISAAYTGGGGSMRVTIYYSVLSTTV